MNSSPVPAGIITPREMIQRLNESIIGQEDAKKALSVAFWKQQMRARGKALPSSGLLLYGPTGCGKTALVQEAAKIADLPVLVFDATTLSEAGYRGRDAADMIVDLVERYGRERATYGVIFLDEVDKLAAVKGNEYRAAYSRGTQHSLLKIVEGCETMANGSPFLTHNILFIFGGAFTGLWAEKMKYKVRNCIGFEREKAAVSDEVIAELSADDFIAYGMEPELMGRIGRCVAIHELSDEELKQILLKSKLSVFQKYQTFFRSYQRDLDMNEETVEWLIRSTRERGLGARGLNTLVEEWVETKLVELSEAI